MLNNRSVIRTWRYRRAIVCAVLSVPLFTLSVYAAYWLRFEGDIGADRTRQIAAFLPVVVAVKVAMFAWCRVYQGWNRYVTFYDLVVMAQAATASSLMLVLLSYFLAPSMVVPRSIFLLDCLATITLFGAIRATLRWLLEFRYQGRVAGGRVRALIVGANDSGETLLRAIRRSRKAKYQIVGFIGDHDQYLPVRIGGIPVLGCLDQLAMIARQQRVGEILITADEFSGKQVREIMTCGNEVDANVRVLPSYDQLLHNRVDLKPRTVSIADLLRRDPVKLDMRGLHQWIDDKVLLVTGSAGSIGSEICRQLLQFEPRQLVLVDRSENGQFYLQRELNELAPEADIKVHVADVGDEPRTRQLLEKYRPDIIFHAAAYKHVPLMEANPGEAIKNIVRATKTVADLAEENRVSSFVMISTDKAVNPTSVMGACKRVAESYVQSMAKNSARCQFVTVRFGNVLDSAGSVVPIFREQIARGGPVTVTHPEMKRYFMMIPEASQLVIQAGAMGNGGEIFVLNMGQPVRIVDLAREMIGLSGLEVGRDIEIKFTGLRPGEKLFEELHIDGEMHLPTVHPKILVAKSTQSETSKLRVLVQQLTELTEAPANDILHTLKRIVPQYRIRPEEPQESTTRRAA